MVHLGVMNFSGCVNRNRGRSKYTNCGSNYALHAPRSFIEAGKCLFNEIDLAKDVHAIIDRHPNCYSAGRRDGQKCPSLAQAEN